MKTMQQRGCGDACQRFGALLQLPQLLGFYEEQEAKRLGSFYAVFTRIDCSVILLYFVLFEGSSGMTRNILRKRMQG